MGCKASTTPKPARAFSDIFAKYKTYDPKVEGYGDPEQWREAFYDRMGFDEAERIINGQEETPRSILGVGPKATWEEIKKAFRAMAMQYHPDRIASTGADPKVAEEMMKKIVAAYTVLEKQSGR